MLLLLLKDWSYLHTCGVQIRFVSRNNESGLLRLQGLQDFSGVVADLHKVFAGGTKHMGSRRPPSR